MEGDAPLPGPPGADGTGPSNLRPSPFSSSDAEMFRKEKKNDFHEQNEPTMRKVLVQPKPAKHHFRKEVTLRCRSRPEVSEPIL